MAFVFRRIHRLIHGAQHYSLDQLKIGALLDTGQHLLIVGRLGLRARHKGNAQLFQKSPQVLQLFILGAFMHTKQRRQLVLLQEFGGTYVGRQHALFNDFVGVVALGGHNALDLAIFTKLDFGFSGFKINGATLVPLGTKGVEQAVEIL